MRVHMRVHASVGKSVGTSVGTSAGMSLDTVVNAHMIGQFGGHCALLSLLLQQVHPNFDAKQVEPSPHMSRSVMSVGICPTDILLDVYEIVHAERAQAHMCGPTHRQLVAVRVNRGFNGS